MENLNKRLQELSDDELAQVTGGTNPICGESFIEIGYDGWNLKNIEPGKEIESVEALKDASAAAVYGSRGANGVILVT